MWKYRGTTVRVPPTADIPYQYRPGKRRSHLVQEVLDGVEPWESGMDPIETIIDLDTPVPEIIVPIEERMVIWAKHNGHYAKRVQLSPFVRTLPILTESFTVVLAKTPEEPMVVRAYPGEYAPPLPWQRMRRLDELEESLVFWRKHAYVYSAGLTSAGSVTTQAPEWF